MSTELDELTRRYLAAAEAGDHALADRLGPQVDALAELERTDRHLDHVAALHGAARFYAGAGLPVFPLVPDGKLPLIGRKHGGQGFLDATTDPTTIDAWWLHTPAANVGVPTGVLFDVLDIDGPDGHRSLTEFLARGGELPAPLGRTRTARPGGWHHLVPLGSLGPTNRAGILPGVDVRAQGGYIVAPPSRVGGKRYVWVDVPEFLRPGGGAA